MLPWQRDDTYQIYEYACNEGNISVGNALRGTAHIEDPNKPKVDPSTLTGSLVGATLDAVNAKLGKPINKLGPRLEFETVEGQPVYVYIDDASKVVSVRPNDLPFEQVKKH
jgi:hypothetical protein